jgi:hypothetical protein
MRLTKRKMRIRNKTKNRRHTKNTKHRRNMRYTRKMRHPRKLRGGRDSTDDESTASTISLDEEDKLIGLGFNEDEIEIIDDLGISLQTIETEYRNALITTGNNGYGLTELRDIPFRDIINAYQLRDLTNTRVTKHDIANLVMGVIGEQERQRQGEIRLDEFMDVEKGGKKKNKHQRKYRH